MTDNLIVDTVRSAGIGQPGRALNSARTNHFILDSPSGPNEAVTNGESFLAGISSCGVTLIEKYAEEISVPLTRAEVTISGFRAKASPNSFQSVSMRFELIGVSQQQAEQLVETYQSR